mgnify:FL=1
MLLTIYVDDFKLAGPTNNLDAGWKLIASKVNIDPPAEANLFLGCLRHKSENVIGG